MVLCALLVAATPVIAAATPADQSPAALSASAIQPVWVSVAIFALATLAAILILRFRWFRLADRGPDGLPVALGIGLCIAFLVFKYLGAMIAMRAAGVELSELNSDSAEPTLRNSVLIMAGSYAAQALCVVAFAVMTLSTRSAENARRSKPLRAMALGFAAILVTLPIVSAVGIGASMVAEWVAGTAPDPIAHDFLRQLIASPRDEWFWLAAGLVTIAAGVCEELTYRGLLQPTFRRLGLSPWGAIAMTSALFALMHLGVAGIQAIVALFVFSLALGWARERSGSVFAPIAMHILFNAANLFVALALVAGTAAPQQ